jgi:hypothetical protein
MMPGTPERRSHDYIRHGTTSLFAALDMATGKVIGSLHRRHRAAELKKFLVRIDEEVPDGLEKDIRAWIALWNDNPRPYVWVKTADQILESLARAAGRQGWSRDRGWRR